MNKVPFDSNEKFAEYAIPGALVSTEWLAANLNTPGLVVVESDEDTLLYEVGHIPGSIKIDWHTDLNDPVTRDYVGPEGFAELMSRKGIGRDTTVIFYGDKSNWWAAYALWVFRLFGHADVRLLDGGRQKWEAEGRELVKEVPTRSASTYPISPRNDTELRAYREQVLSHVNSKGCMVDVRSPQEFSGELTHMPDYPPEVGGGGA